MSDTVLAKDFQFICGASLWRAETSIGNGWKLAAEFAVAFLCFVIGIAPKETREWFSQKLPIGRGA